MVKEYNLQIGDKGHKEVFFNIDSNGRKEKIIILHRRLKLQKYVKETHI